MGGRGTDILQNDTSADVYGMFMDRYKAGEKPSTISQQLMAEHEEEIANDEEEYQDTNDFWLALGFAQRKTNSLESQTIKEFNLSSIMELI